MSRTPPVEPGPHPAGLCGSCRHARVVRNRRGSTFWLCGRAVSDPRFRRYPPLPVIACPGWESGVQDERGSRRQPEDAPYETPRGESK